MKKTDLAYIAGLFDGEGCIRIGKSRHPKRLDYTFLCSLSISNQYIPELLRMFFGGHIRIRNFGPPRRTQWDWSVSSENAVTFLKLVYPYLILKKGQADVAFLYQGAINRRRELGQHRLTEEEKAIREAEYLMLRNLKKV